MQPTLGCVWVDAREVTLVSIPGPGCFLFGIVPMICFLVANKNFWPARLFCHNVSTLEPAIYGLQGDPWWLLGQKWSLILKSLERNLVLKKEKSHTHDPVGNYPLLTISMVPGKSHLFCFIMDWPIWFSLFICLSSSTFLFCLNPLPYFPLYKFCLQIHTVAPVLISMITETNSYMCSSVSKSCHFING